MARSRSSYSREFKDAIVTKIVNRGSLGIAEVCAKEGVRTATASRWLKRDILGDMKTKPTAKTWSPKEKLQAVSQTLAKSETDTGLYLRKEGLHSQQVDEWKSQALASFEPQPRRAVKDVRDERIKELEREILRKDKALAEASALLILQKKVNLIWGDEDPK
jgi:transposase-like protein